MAEEEDEVDILGDFSLDNLLSKDDGRLGSCYVSGVLGPQGAELLNCDYNIGSQWLLDTPNQSCWYTSADDTKSYDRHQFGFSTSLVNGVSDALPSTSHWDENDSWTEKEKSLLEKGVELFGTSWPRISQFIGTKTSQQVKVYASTHNFHQQVADLTFKSPSHCTSDVFNFSEIIDDMQIPASMEEVIAVVSTAQPTVATVQKRNMATSTLSKHSSARDCSKKKNYRDVNRLKSSRGRCHPAAKFLNNKRGPKTATHTPKRIKIERKPTPVLPLCSSEEVIKIKKESDVDSDMDEEIDVDDGSDHDSEPAAVRIQKENQLEEEKRKQAEAVQALEERMKEEHEEKGRSSAVQSGEEDSFQAGHSHHDVLESIFNMPAPSQEIVLDPDKITNEERSVHTEFFEGRSAKTPKRYLKIRNHIVECWQQNRPAYVTKTSVRSGLKHCGDVNCIGRIHAYLEQIGAINFGCEQARYANPVALVPPMPTARRKLNKEQLAAMQQARIDAMRPRKKKQSPIVLDGDGGYTITHSESGEAIHTTVIQDVPHTARTHKADTAKSNAIRLISCSKYSEKKPAPFEVHLSVGALLVVDVHGHSSQAEVAGLLGGHWDLEAGVLHLRRAAPCRSSSSGTHCDMCPVSQTEASEALQNDGLDVVGWYHSHPTFLPNPSLQDLNTQTSMQQWFGQTAGSPIVSLILTPYCPTNPTFASQFRCITVESDDVSLNPCGTPYMFSVKVSADDLNVPSMLKDMAAIFSLVEENHRVAVDFDAAFQQGQSISYKQKCVESAKLHLASCNASVSSELCNDVVQGILQACSTLNLARGAQQK